MIRSQWMGPVFGVLALAGLAWGQTSSSFPAGAGQDHFVTVQEAGKPVQRCKVLKTWTEPNGTRAYQAEALDTGELMTIEESDPKAPAPGVLVRSAATRIFSWGRGTSAPVGAPEPPPTAVVVGYPIEIHPMTAEPPRLAAAPALAPATPHGKWPAAFAATPTSEHFAAAEHMAAAPVIDPLPPAPVAKKADLAPLPATQALAGPMGVAKVELAPLPPPQVVANPVHVAPTTVTPVAAQPGASSPYGAATAAKAEPEHKKAPTEVNASGSPYGAATAGKTEPEHKKAPTEVNASGSPYAANAGDKVVAKPTALAPSTWVVKTPDATSPATAAHVWAATTWKPSPAPAPAAAAVTKVETTPAPAKAPAAVARVETTPAQPADWRQSWGQLDAPHAAPPSIDLPHAQARADDPLKSPDKYAKKPHDAFASDKPAPDKPAPVLANLALERPPATLQPDMTPAELHPAAPPVVIAAPPPATPLPPTASAPPVVIAAPPPATPPPPAPSAPPVVIAATPPPAPAAKPSPVLAPIPAAPMAVADAKPATAPAKPELKPMPDQPKPEPKPAVPLGMASVLAAASPELAPPAPPQAAAQEKAATALNADEPNAFTENPKSGAVASAPNAFSQPMAPEAAARAEAVAMNAFRPQPAYAQPPYSPPVMAMRSTTPAPAPAAFQAPTGYVLPAGYRQETASDLSQWTAVLRGSLYPSQREWAAESLASMDWRKQPQIVDLLVERAKQDPAPTVRAECVRSLGRMKADSPAAVEAVKALQSDADEHVRQEAIIAYAEMTGAAPH